MSKEKAREIFLRRLDALVDHVLTVPNPVVRIRQSDWHWIEPLMDDGDASHYRGVRIELIE